MNVDGADLLLLLAVRTYDEYDGGLPYAALDPEARERVGVLVERGWVEYVGGYGEAPDGEEDEREMGGDEGVYRITALGVEALRDSR